MPLMYTALFIDSDAAILNYYVAGIHKRLMTHLFSFCIRHLGVA